MSARKVAGATLLALAASAASAADLHDPWADVVVSYDAGMDPSPGYTDPQVALGMPERYTGEGAYPGAVTPFNSAWGTDEIVSVGAGGHLTVKFDEPIIDAPAHLYGVDLLIFGNGAFIDGDYPNGRAAGLFSDGPFSVSVSADGSQYFTVATDLDDAMYPALGYLDLAGPYDPNPGAQPSDFLLPVNPAFTLADFVDKTFPEIVALYGGSGGGIPIDISSTGLGQVSYVRIDVPLGASSPEIDGLAAVPEPSSALLFGGMLWSAARWKQRRRSLGQSPRVGRGTCPIPTPAWA